MSKKSRIRRTNMSAKSSTGFVPGPNDVQVPYVQRPVATHRWSTILLTATCVGRAVSCAQSMPAPRLSHLGHGAATTDKDADLPAFEQRFMLIEA